jgi:hypothetical protein
MSPPSKQAPPRAAQKSYHSSVHSQPDRPAPIWNAGGPSGIRLELGSFRKYRQTGVGWSGENSYVADCSLGVRLLPPETDRYHADAVARSRCRASEGRELRIAGDPADIVWIMHLRAALPTTLMMTPAWRAFISAQNARHMLMSRRP